MSGGELIQADEPFVGNYFVSVYPPFSTWTTDDLHHVERVLDAPSHNANRLGLYVHVPFCVERCQFCYYLSYADKSPSDFDAYLDAIARELTLYRERPALAGRELSFVYFGGGTPSLLPARTIEGFLSRLQGILPWGHVEEATFECAPKSVTREKMEILRGAGITRVSLGVQQLDDDVLQKNGRIHRVSDVEQALDCIRTADFRVLNLDLMVGLVGETDETVLATLERVIQVQPDSVTVYQLEIPHNTPLYRALHEGTVSTPPAHWTIKHRRLLECFSRLEKAGYTPRSGYTVVRDPKVHGFVYQDAQYFGADLIGLGAASFSYVAGVHYQNAASFPSYMGRMGQGGLPAARAHCLDHDERVIREFVLQLKLGTVRAKHFREKFGADILARFGETLADCARRGWLTYDDNGVMLTRAGLVRVDHLIPAFYPPRLHGVRYT